MAAVLYLIVVCFLSLCFGAVIEQRLDNKQQQKNVIQLSEIRRRRAG